MRPKSGGGINRVSAVGAQYIVPRKTPEKTKHQPE